MSINIKVTKQGICFGDNCWVSHEKISGNSAEQLNKGGHGVIAQQYMKWVQTTINKQAA